MIYRALRVMTARTWASASLGLNGTNSLPVSAVGTCPGGNITVTYADREETYHTRDTF
jgi:hypothetical protein